VAAAAEGLVDEQPGVHSTAGKEPEAQLVKVGSRWELRLQPREPIAAQVLQQEQRRRAEKEAGIKRRRAAELAAVLSKPHASFELSRVEGAAAAGDVAEAEARRRLLEARKAAKRQ